MARRACGLEQCCDSALAQVQVAFNDFVAGEGFGPHAVARALDHGEVSDVFVRSNIDDLDQVVRFAQLLLDSLSGKDLAAPTVVMGIAELLSGRAQKALEEFESALDSDPGCPAAAKHLAVLEVDRGNLARAHQLILGHIVDAEGGPGLFGVPILVPLDARQSLVAVIRDGGSAESLAGWFGSNGLLTDDAESESCVR